MKPTYEQLEAENKALKEEVEDWRDTQKAVMSEACPSDEKHCTCVPVLRKENKALKERCEAYLNELPKYANEAARKENFDLAIQLVAVREKLKRLYNNGRGCEVFPATHVVGEQEATEGFLIVHELLNTPPPTLVAQMEKKMEVAGKMVKVVELLRTMTPANRLTSSEWNRVNEALTLWNTANGEQA